MDKNPSAAFRHMFICDLLFHRRLCDVGVSADESAVGDGLISTNLVEIALSLYLPVASPEYPI